MKRIHLLTGEEQIPFREKDVSKDSDASKEKNIHHYWLFQVILPLSAPLFIGWRTAASFVTKKPKTSFEISLLGKFLWHDSVGVVKFLTDFSQHHSSLT